MIEFNHPSEGEQKQAEGLRNWMMHLRELSGVYEVAAHIYELMV